jgi:hypothetical protein
MRTQEELEAMMSHPSAQPVDDASGGTDHQEDDHRSPYKRFFDALEELDDNCTLYGPGSLEARISRARVERYRALAAETWRNRQAA